MYYKIRYSFIFQQKKYEGQFTIQATSMAAALAEGTTVVEEHMNGTVESVEIDHTF